MNPHRHMNRQIATELDTLVERGILRTEQADILKRRYPTTPWNWLGLARAFTVLGILTIVAGLMILVKDYLNWWLVSEGALAVTTAVLLAIGYWLKRYKGLAPIGEALELAGSFALQGLTVVLATHYSTGSKNWPSLVGIDVLLLTALAYALANRYILAYACVNFFFYLGAQTGYLSGWGAYYLGMTYPIRYLAVGGATILLAILHGMVIRGRWAQFSRVYAHFGLLVTNLALWFLSLFGYYEKMDVRWSDTDAERLFFSIAWAVVAGLSMYVGARTGLRLLRGYGLTFLIINVYTFYFQFVACKTAEGWFLHLLIIGGSLLWLGFHLERTRRDAVAKVPKS